MKQATRFSEPCTLAYERMKTILFRPFDAGKWFVLGFSAWLATLGESGSSYSGDFPTGGTGSGDEEETEIQSPMEELEGMWNTTMQWIQDNQWVIAVAIVGVILIVAFSILICWLSSRGKFMFLDNVVHNRSEVALPWREYKAEGNSLFRWLIVFHLVTGLLLIATLGGAGFSLFSEFKATETFTPLMITTVVVASLVFLVFLLVVSYIWTLLTDLVVPQMYKHRMSTSEAWKRVRALQRERGGALFVYFLLKILLGLASGLIMILFGLVTCCIGFFVLAIPYLGAVLMLPVTVFFCALGPEFSRQFGSNFDLWEESLPQIESL